MSMSANNKLLLLMIAFSAFAIGLLLQSKKQEQQLEAHALLSARLIQVTESGPQLASINEQLKTLTLVNFWASWCAPCREEMPLFESYYRLKKQQGFQIIGVAIDSPEKTRAMLDSMDISYPILYAEQSGMELMASIGNPNGLLPYSVLLDAQGKVLDTVLGRVDEAQLNQFIASSSNLFKAN